MVVFNFLYLQSHSPALKNRMLPIDLPPEIIIHPNLMLEFIINFAAALMDEDADDDLEEDDDDLEEDDVERIPICQHNITINDCGRDNDGPKGIG
jgi:hypothetical protein